MGELRKSMVLDGAAATSAIDSSGESIDLDGLDITEFEEGRATVNYEHRGPKDEGASANDVIGAVTYAKKIYSEKDCEDERQKMYWKQIQLPFLYIKAELFNDEGHPGALAAAALIRYYHRRKLPILARWSIEGSTLEREGNTLKRCLAKKVAYTLAPCNRSCYSGVVSDSDSNEIASAIEDLEGLARSQDPGKRILASFTSQISSVVNDPVELLKNSLESLKEFAELNKAISAGSYNAAPDSLTGGAALQAEEVSPKEYRLVRSGALAALRDWDRKTPFKAFLKNRLRDVSDSFINHFVQLVDDYHLKKQEELEANLTLAFLAKASPRTVAPPTIEHHAKEGETNAVDNTSALTFRGNAVPGNPGVKGSYFDEKQGILHTPRGSFKAFPDLGSKAHRKELDKILNDPKVTGFHDQVLRNWSKVRKQLKSGNLSPDLVMHATLFSLMSPQTPVPIQELMWSHLADVMDETGIKASNPKFAKDPIVYHSWLDRNHANVLPDIGRAHFEGPQSNGITVKNPTDTGRKPGDIAGYQMADQKFNAISRYHNVHGYLTDLVKRHGVNGQSAVAELMQNKLNGGPTVFGLAPKTARYALGMLGAGNVHIPDTHMSRYTFGLDPEKDTNTINYVKNVLWDENNGNILNGIDRYFVQNHPVIQSITQHPKYGNVFEDPSQAAFQGFWKLWGAIPHIERSLGMNPRAFNEGATHAPFWEVANRYTKSEHDEPLALHSAKQHHKWVQEHGEIPALGLYYAYLAPHLLESHLIQKMEGTVNTLLKAAKEVAGTPELPNGPVGHKFKGGYVTPGEIEIVSGIHKGSKLHYLGSDKEHVYVKPHEDSDEHAVQLKKLPRTMEGKAFIVNKEPVEVPVTNLVNADIHGHGIHNQTAEQRALIHGIDLNKQADVYARLHGMTSRNRGAEAGFYQSAAGKIGYVKPDMTPTFSFDEALWSDQDLQQEVPFPHREAIYHNLARDYFGLAQHVPVTSTFVNPQTSEHMSSMEQVPNGVHYDSDDDDATFALHQAGENGSLDKLSMMDVLLGQDDRHDGNIMLTKEAPFVHHIDNSLMFNYEPGIDAASNTRVGGFNPPDHIKYYFDQHPNLKDYYPSFNETPIHPEAAKWALGLNPDELKMHLLAHGVPDRFANKSYNRLKALHQLLWGGQPTRGDLMDLGGGQFGNPEGEE